MSCSTHFSSTFGISAVRSQKLHPLKPAAVWLESIAGGSTAHSTPQALRSGSATVVEHCPTQLKSCIVKRRFIRIDHFFLAGAYTGFRWRMYSRWTPSPASIANGPTTSIPRLENSIFQSGLKPSSKPVIASTRTDGTP